MYFSKIYLIFFLDSFFHILYPFEKSEIFMPHPVYIACLSFLSEVKCLVIRLIILVSQTFKYVSSL